MCVSGVEREGEREGERERRERNEFVTVTDRRMELSVAPFLLSPVFQQWR